MFQAFVGFDIMFLLKPSSEYGVKLKLNVYRHRHDAASIDFSQNSFPRVMIVLLQHLLQLAFY